jgi:protein O-GlcNAc transferase
MYQIERKGKKVAFVGEYGHMYSGCFKEKRFYEEDFLSYIETLNIQGEYLDIGGNIGNHALFFTLFCPADIVHTFEPVEKYQSYIRQNIRANDLEAKIVLHTFGLSDSADPISFRIGGRTQTINNLVSLDEADIDFQKIGLMKIDCEGSEDKVLNGAYQTIKKHKPRIFVEIMEEIKLTQIERKLVKLGYQRTSNVFNASPTYEFIAT